MGPTQSVKCKVCLTRDATVNGLCDECRNTGLVRKIHEGSLPWFYGLLLNLPGVDRIERASGLFWVLIVPILVFLNVLLTLVLLISFPFPINILLVAIVPASVLVIFVRLGLERFINLWNLLVASSPVEWNVERSAKEYVQMLKNQERREKLQADRDKTLHEECE